jgi:tRNA A-37 threonylcarbamoyl transferase component Bud32
VIFKFAQIILGVCVLHINKVAHFDLKPENILVDEDGRLKICLYFIFFFFFLKKKKKQLIMENLDH